MAIQRHDGQWGEDRKVDQVVCEFKRYAEVEALQETKWLGCEVYEVTVAAQGGQQFLIRIIECSIPMGTVLVPQQEQGPSP